MSRYCREGGAGSLERPCRSLGPGRTQQKDVGEQTQEGRQDSQAQVKARMGIQARASPQG